MKKDLSTKSMLKCRDVFSDICNVNLFGEEGTLSPEQLELMPTETIYHGSDGNLREHRMDVRMKHKGSKTDIAVFCMENQSGTCNTMPVRDMGYLYSGYNEQIQRIRVDNAGKGLYYFGRELGDDQKLVPVISLILYYGIEDWTGPVSLMDILEIPEEWRDKLEPLIADHSIRVIHLAAQDEETRKKYRSDFRHVVDYLAYVRAKDKKKLKEYMKDKGRKVVHPREYLDMMYAFTSDKRYREIAENLIKRGKEKEETDMCIMLDMLEESGVKKGRREGRREGQREGRLEGRREGRLEEMTHGMRVLTETCQELGVSLSDTAKRVAEKFDVSPAKAEKEVYKYWK